MFWEKGKMHAYRGRDTKNQEEQHELSPFTIFEVSAAGRAGGR